MIVLTSVDFLAFLDIEWWKMYKRIKFYFVIKFIIWL